MSNNFYLHPDYHYVQAAVLCELRSNFNDFIDTFRSEEDHVNMIDRLFTIELNPNILAAILEKFVEEGIFEEIRDDRAGAFFKLSKDDLLQRYNNEIEDASSIASKYNLIGQQFLASALRNKDTDRDDFEHLETKSLHIPAAGRVVEIDHNQATEIDKPTIELINALEADNGLSDAPGFRERILGQIKAGRELIRAGIFDAQLFHLSMVVGLKMLIEKYKEHAIGAAASKLLDLIYESIGSSIT